MRMNPLDWLQMRFPNYKPKGHNYAIEDCPYCGNHNYNCEVTINRGFKCWSCGIGGSFVKFVSDQEGIPYREVKKLIKLPRKHKSVREQLEVEEDKAEPEQLGKCLPYKSWNNNAQRYAKDRGWDEHCVHQYALLFCYEGRFRQRIIFPYSEDGVLVYWQGRTIHEHVERRWMFPKSQSRGHLFNIERQQPGKTMIIVEGPADAVAVDGVAIGGKHLSEEKIEKILEVSPKEVIIWLDRDAVADAWILGRMLAPYVRTKVYTMHRYSDPSDSKGKELKRALRYSVDYSEPNKLLWKLRGNSCGEIRGANSLF